MDHIYDIITFPSTSKLLLRAIIVMFKLFDPNSNFNIIEGSNLPHWFQPQVTYFVTFRTEDSLPKNLVEQWYIQRSKWLYRHSISNSTPDWKAQFLRLPEKLRIQFHKTFSSQYLEYLDKGFGACILKRPELSKIVADSLFHFDGDRYHIGDFVIMPNHVHLLVCLLGETDLLKQCRSWKRFSANEINKALGRKGRFWQVESFDHLVRSPEQFLAIQQYIRNNPKHLKENEYYLHQI